MTSAVMQLIGSEAALREEGPRYPARRVPAARERMLHRLWANQRLGEKGLRTEDGRSLQVVFPGWPTHDRGPDFRGAIVAIEDGRLLQGEVEVHIHARDWQGHGHHLDPHYDSVVLHVVWNSDGLFETRTSTGELVPTLVLETKLNLPLEVLLLAGPDRKQDPRPCVRHTPDAVVITELIEQEGLERFLAKAAGRAGDAAAFGWEEALWIGLLDALGYSKNRIPFGELAQALPFRTLSALAAGKNPASALSYTQAVLLGTAGLLPSQKGAGPHCWDALETAWREYGGSRGVTTPWQTFRVRPENAPVRRVMAAGHLAARYARQGLLAGLLDTASGEPARIPERIVQALLVQDADGKALLGQTRALDAVVNVVLPLLHAWATERGDAFFASRILEAYRACPPLADNYITQDMEHMLLPGGQAKLFASALRQQGLVRIYQKRCMGLHCQGCALGGN